MQVIVYKNLRRGDWSVAELVGARGRGKVIDHKDQITLQNVTFHVSEASRQAVIRKHERSVHAYAIGTIVADQPASADPISYNPYRGPTFTTKDGQVVAAAQSVTFATDGKAYFSR